MRLEERLERKEHEAVVKAIMRFRRKKHMTFYPNFVGHESWG